MVVTGKMLSLPISDNKVHSNKQFILIRMDEWNGIIIMPRGNTGVCPLPNQQPSLAGKNKCRENIAGRKNNNSEILPRS